MAILDDLNKRKENEQAPMVQTSEYKPVDGEDTQQSDIQYEEPSSKKLNIKTLIIVLAGILVLGVGAVVFSMVDWTGGGQEEPDFMTESDPVFEYTQEQREALRLAGFTGDEIENFQYSETNVNGLVEEAERKRMEQYEKEIGPFRDALSPEYKQLESLTWLGQEDLVYNKDKSLFTYHTMTYNADFEKLPPKGYQLFLKVYLNNSKSKYAFMVVTPERYNELLDTGNIVLSIDYTQPETGEKIITNITEIIN